MPEPLDAALAEVRALLLDHEGLVRAVAAGRRRGSEPPSPLRAQLRPVQLKAGRRLQLVTFDGIRPTTQNLEPDAAPAAIDVLLREPYGNWHVQTRTATLQLRVTKRGEAQVHRSAPPSTVEVQGHDRVKAHLLAPDHPLYSAIGASAAKRRQVDAFLRILASTVEDPVHVVDLGCGNAYLTFAAVEYLRGLGHPVRVTGVDVRADQRERNTALAHRLGVGDLVTFQAATILESTVDIKPDLVLALHACDTATDEALARAVRWGARHILAAPCCHHDIAAQLRARPSPDPYALVTQHGILRERFADVLTDSLRAALLRLHGYRVDVVEFVDSQHTPRNLLLRAHHTGATPTERQLAQYQEMIGSWGVTPHLATLLAPEIS